MNFMTFSYSLCVDLMWLEIRKKVLINWKYHQHNKIITFMPFLFLSVDLINDFPLGHKNFIFSASVKTCVPSSNIKQKKTKYSAETSIS